MVKNRQKQIAVVVLLDVTGVRSKCLGYWVERKSIGLIDM